MVATADRDRWHRAVAARVAEPVQAVPQRSLGMGRLRCQDAQAHGLGERFAVDLTSHRGDRLYVGSTTYPDGVTGLNTRVCIQGN